MRQRNISGGPLIIPDIPARVEPGDEIDWDTPVAGFEPVESPAAPVKPVKATGKDKTSTGSADTGTGEGGADT